VHDILVKTLCAKIVKEEGENLDEITYKSNGGWISSKDSSQLVGNLRLPENCVPCC